MSEEFEVKGPHEEVLEGGGGEGDRGFNNQIAVMTAIMATIGALLSYQASVTLGEAILLKNEAAIKKTEAADQWNFYQAKSNKQNLAELATILTNGKDLRKVYAFPPSLGNRSNDAADCHFTCRYNYSYAP